MHSGPYWSQDYHCCFQNLETPWTWKKKCVQAKNVFGCSVQNENSGTVGQSSPLQILRPSKHWISFLSGTSCRGHHYFRTPTFRVQFRALFLPLYIEKKQSLLDNAQREHRLSFLAGWKPAAASKKRQANPSKGAPQRQPCPLDNSKGGLHPRSAATLKPACSDPACIHVPLSGLPSHTCSRAASSLPSSLQELWSLVSETKELNPRVRLCLLSKGRKKQGLGLAWHGEEGAGMTGHPDVMEALWGSPVQQGLLS